MAVLLFFFLLDYIIIQHGSLFKKLSIEWQSNITQDFPFDCFDYVRLYSIVFDYVRLHSIDSIVFDWPAPRSLAWAAAKIHHQNRCQISCTVASLVPVRCKKTTKQSNQYSNPIN